MILEYAQLLSTAHRVIDGHEHIGSTLTGRKVKRCNLGSSVTGKLPVALQYVS